MIYKVEFPDGQCKEYAANIMAESMLTQVDSDAYSSTKLNAVINYWKDGAVAVPNTDSLLSLGKDRRDPDKQLVDGPY